MRGPRSGENSLEFALILPVLLVIIFGIFETGWYFNRYLVVSGATRDAARSASMVPEGGDVDTLARSIVLDRLGELADPDGVVVTTSVEGETPDRTVTVRVVAPYTAFAGKYVPAPGSIESVFSLHMEEEQAELDE